MMSYHFILYDVRTCFDELRNSRVCIRIHKITLIEAKGQGRGGLLAGLSDVLGDP